MPKPSERKAHNKTGRVLGEWHPTIRKKRSDLVKAYISAMKAERRLDAARIRLRKEFEKKLNFPEGEKGKELLDEKIEKDAGIEALKTALKGQHKSLGELLARYDETIKAYAKAKHGKPYSELSSEERAGIDKIRITVEGTKRELKRKAREHEQQSLSTVSLPRFGKLLSFRLGVMGREQRDQAFKEAVREAIKHLPKGLTGKELELKKREIEEKLRQPDRYIIAKQFGWGWTSYRRYLRIPDLREEIEKTLTDIKQVKTKADYQYHEALLAQLLNFYRRRLLQLSNLLRNTISIKTANKEELEKLSRKVYFDLSAVARRVGV